MRVDCRRGDLWRRVGSTKSCRYESSAEGTWSWLHPKPIQHCRHPSGTYLNRDKISISQRLYSIGHLSCRCYGCESWTLTADLERRIQAFENKCYRSMLGISYREHKTNEYVWQKVSILAGPQEPLLSTITRRKLSWFGHVCRQWYATEDHFSHHTTGA